MIPARQYLYHLGILVCLGRPACPAFPDFLGILDNQHQHRLGILVYLGRLVFLAYLGFLGILDYHHQALPDFLVGQQCPVGLGCRHYLDVLDILVGL